MRYIVHLINGERYATDFEPVNHDVRSPDGTLVIPGPFFHARRVGSASDRTTAEMFITDNIVRVSDREPN